VDENLNERLKLEVEDEEENKPLSEKSSYKKKV
jgi:hypothetical protein